MKKITNAFLAASTAYVLCLFARAVWPDAIVGQYILGPIMLGLGLLFIVGSFVFALKSR